jgi:hypothetical protein
MAGDASSQNPKGKKESGAQQESSKRQKQPGDWLVELEKKDAELRHREDRVSGREKEAENKQAALEKREGLRRAKEQEVTDKLAELSTKESDLAKLQQRLEKQEAQLVHRQRQVVDRENAADLGFLQQNSQSLAVLETERDKLRTDIAELERKRQEAKTSLAIETNDFRLAQLKLVEEELNSRRRQCDAELGAKHSTLDQERRATEDERTSLERQRLFLEQERAESKREFTRLTETARLNISDEFEQAKWQAKLAQEECDVLRKRIQVLEVERLDFGGRSAKDILNEQSRLQEAVAALEGELARRPTEQDLASAREMEARLEAEREVRRQLEAKYKQLNEELHLKSMAELQVEKLRDQRNELKASLLTLRTFVDSKIQEYETLLAQVRGASPTTRVKEGEAEYSKRLGDITTLRFVTRQPAPSPKSEKAWLQSIEDKIEKADFYYPRRLLHAFHTCLKIAKWAPLTVLAGVSGTGKSELPRLYALYGGAYFDSLAVQTEWKTPQDIFGYFNYLDGRFNAKPVLQAMAQSQRPLKEGGFEKQQLLLILLDEMNLSRVEDYLSDLLSKWELRRGQKEDVFLEFELGGNCDKYKMPLGTNVLFAGTINEDESTQALYDKVLDRSNVLYFPRPKKFVRRDNLDLGEMQAPLKVEDWQRWVRDPASLNEQSAERSIYQESLERINDQLDSVNRPLGHRLWQTIEVYMANHPDVIEAIDLKDEDKLSKAMRCAYEDQLVQRVVPRLRGMEVDRGAARQCLDAIGEEIRKHATGLSNDYRAAIESGRRTFFWRQSDYLYNGTASGK